MSFKADEILELLYKIDSRLDIIEKYLHFEDEQVADILEELLEEDEAANNNNSRPMLTIVSNDDDTIVEFPTEQNTGSWLSGLKHPPTKRTNVNSVPRVRIPGCPPRYRISIFMNKCPECKFELDHNDFCPICRVKR